MKRLLVIVRIGLIRLVYYAARVLPLRQKVVLATSHKSRIDGNLACIHEELGRRDLPGRVATVAYRPERGLRGLVRTALHEAGAAYHLATATLFIVDDYFFPIYAVRPRRGTSIIQTWHAVAPVKRSGYGVVGKTFGADERLVGRVRIHSNYDVILTGSKAAAVSYSQAFGQPLGRFVTSLGIPRTDLLFGEERIARARDHVRSRYGLDAGRRVVLYAPTFRGDEIIAASFPDFLDFDLLHAELGDDHVLLVRKHPFVRTNLRFAPELADFIVDVSDYPEVNELMQVVDILVTDYSSLIYEFALLGRPILFFAPDHEAYERQRGFFLDYRADGPGPVFETTRELADHLRRGEFDYARVERFRRKWFEIADGHSSQRFVDQLVLPQLRPAA